MRRYIGILMIIALAAFASGSVAQAATAADMSAKMTLAMIDGVAMGDCQDCPDGSEDMQSCDIVCVAPVLAVVPSGPLGLPEVEAAAGSLVPQDETGRTGPPDPYPPRSTILS